MVGCKLITESTCGTIIIPVAQSAESLTATPLEGWETAHSIGVTCGAFSGTRLALGAHVVATAHAEVLGERNAMSFVTVRAGLKREPERPA